MILGHKIIGEGAECVLVMHDWFCDSTSYDPILPYLNGKRYRYVFVDLKGYGESKSIAGPYSLEEACKGVMSLIEYLGWQLFHVIGHSMSAIIAQYLAWKMPHQVQSVIAVTPPSLSELPPPAEVMAFLEEAAKQNDEAAYQVVHFLTGHRYTEGFVKYKVRKWRATSLPAARVDYLHMFMQTNLSQQVQGLQTPFLVITGKHDSEQYQESAIKDAFSNCYPNIQFVNLSESGHYPMQEVPVLLATIIENYVANRT